MRPIIREAGIDDLPEIIPMAQDALSQIHPHLPSDAEVLAATIQDGIAAQFAAVLVAEDADGLCGLLIAKAEPSWFGPGWVASDWLTYVKSRAKGWLWYRLVEVYADWAESLGVNVINTINLSGKNDARAVHAISRLGFEKAGSMVRRITPTGEA